MVIVQCTASAPSYMGGLGRKRPDMPYRCRSVGAGATVRGSVDCTRAQRIDQAGAEGVVALAGPIRFAVFDEDRLDLDRLQPGIPFQHQRHHAADLRRGDRRAGRELVGALRRRHQDVDAGRGDRDVCRGWRRGTACRRRR